jgi:hypothetical protein
MKNTTHTHYTKQSHSPANLRKHNHHSNTRRRKHQQAIPNPLDPAPEFQRKEYPPGSTAPRLHRGELRVTCARWEMRRRKHRTTERCRSLGLCNEGNRDGEGELDWDVEFRNLLDYWSMPGFSCDRNRNPCCSFSLSLSLSLLSSLCRSCSLGGFRVSCQCEHHALPSVSVGYWRLSLLGFRMSNQLVTWKKKIDCCAL